MKMNMAKQSDAPIVLLNAANKKDAGSCGVVRGKGCNQRESAKPKHVPYTETEKRVTGG